MHERRPSWMVRDGPVGKLGSDWKKKKKKKMMMQEHNITRLDTSFMELRYPQKPAVPSPSLPLQLMHKHVGSPRNPMHGSLVSWGVSSGIQQLWASAETRHITREGINRGASASSVWHRTHAFLLDFFSEILSEWNRAHLSYLEMDSSMIPCRTFVEPGNLWWYNHQFGLGTWGENWELTMDAAVDSEVGSERNWRGRLENSHACEILTFEGDIRSTFFEFYLLQLRYRSHIN